MESDLNEMMLVRQLKAGNEKAYQFLYEHHYVVLCHIAESYVKDKFTAESIVGDTIFHLWEIREKLDISVSVRKYLVSAVRNRCLNCLSAEENYREITFSTLSEEGIYDVKTSINDSHPLGILLEKELESEIMGSIEKLPKECRCVFVKSRFEGKSYDEISCELNISVNTVKYHIKSALAMLRKSIGKYLIVYFLFFALN